MKLNIRAQAAKIISDAIIKKTSLQILLQQTSGNSAADQALLQAICYGVMRYYEQLQFLITLLLEKPLPGKQLVVKHLLMVGVLQIVYMRVAEHAAIFETVAAAAQLNIVWASKLVNAILRNLQRNQADLLQQLQRHPTALLAHPAWLLDAINIAWPAYAKQIFAANLEHPPVAIRLNTKQFQTSDILANFSAQHLLALPIAETNAGFIIATDQDLTKLPEFAQGMFSLQDGAAQFAAQLLELAPNLKVLDACAAPGGKTCNLLELEPSLALTALDISSKRLALVTDNLDRLKLPAVKLLVADASQTTIWWDGQQFDRILLDAPCSALGIIRRQPDIKELRTIADLQTAAARQAALLQALWPLLKPGGILLYATCSIMPIENMELIAQFVAATPDAKVQELPLKVGVKLKYGHQILPGQNNLDGFYYCKLVKAD